MRSTIQGINMYETIEELRRKFAPFKDGRYLIGLSGGADSVALLMLLLPLIRERRINAEAIHVNHGLRGVESDEDERFCSMLCKKEGISLTVFRANLAGKKDENSARKARFAAFRERYTETGSDGLILAHHADDQAETYLMRLLRGAGPDGLACMKTDETVGGIRILRPMLAMRREEIRNALQNDGISWREDTSNENAVYLRNRIRKELIPLLTSISGTAVEKICIAAKITGEDNVALNIEAKTILDRVSDGPVLDAEALMQEDTAIRRRVLRIWWQQQGPTLKEHALNVTQTEAIDELLGKKKGKINLPGEMHAVRDGKYLFLTGYEKEMPDPVTVTGNETVFGAYLLKETESEGNPGDGRRTQEVPPGFTRGCVIRTRQPGDRIRPFGSQGSKKLQDYLTDKRIPEPFRDCIPMLCRGKDVLLVCGVGAGNIPTLDQYSSSVRLTWYGKTPWREITGKEEENGTERQDISGS